MFEEIACIKATLNIIQSEWKESVGLRNYQNYYPKLSQSSDICDEIQFLWRLL